MLNPLFLCFLAIFNDHLQSDTKAVHGSPLIYAPGVGLGWSIAEMKGGGWGSFVVRDSTPSAHAKLGISVKFTGKLTKTEFPEIINKRGCA